MAALEEKGEMDILGPISAGFTDEGEPGAPEDPSPETEGEGAEALACLLMVGSNMLAARRGAHWELSEEESLALAKPLETVMEKYMGTVSVGPEAALVVASLMVIGPRLATDSALAKKADQEQREAAKNGQEAV